MENLDCTVVKQLNTGTERKALTVFKLESMCNWEQFLMPAPTSIAILGQLMAIATTKDFSLKNQEPVNGFKYIDIPGSFRACLVQISDSACDAFMEAHKSMDKIQMYTTAFQDNMRQSVDILINGSENDKTQLLPCIFEEMKDDAGKCLDLAKATEKKFLDVTLLVNEIAKCSAAARGAYEGDMMEALEQMKLLEKEEKQLETRKQEMEEEKKRVIEDLGKAKSLLDKSIDNVPGIGSLILMNTVEEGIKMATGAMNLFGQYQMMSISEGVALANVFKGKPEKSSESSNPSENKTVEDTQNQHQPVLKLAYQHATDIHVCIEGMYEMFTEDTNSEGKQEKTIDTNEHDTVLDGIKDELIKLNDEFKKSEFAKNPLVLRTQTICEEGIELCGEMLIVNKEHVDELFGKVDKLKGKSKGIQLKARNHFHCSPVSIPKAAKLQTSKKSKSKRTIEIASENARYEVELRRKELDDARRARENFQNEFRKMDERQNSVLERLSKTKINSIDFEEIQKTLKDGLIIMSKLKQQWSYLVVFFQNITSGIEVCLSQRTLKLDKRLRNCEYSVSHITRDVMLEMASSINAVAYAVQLIATAYTEISQKHLIPNTASLVELIAYDSVKDADKLNERRIQIGKDCKEAKDEIQALAERSRKDMDTKMKSMYERLEEQLNKIPPLPQAKVKEIKENVKKSSMSVDDYV